MLEDREKKLVYIAVSIIVILIVIIIAIIWVPMFINNDKEVELASVNEYEEGYYLSTMKEEYKTIVSTVVDKNNFESTYELLDQDYLDEMNMTKEELEDYLTTNSILTYTTTTAVVYCDKVLTDGEKYIYAYVYKVGNVERKVYIIEEYYGSYTISLLQDAYPILNDTEYDVIDSETQLEFKIKVAKSYEENVVLDITIINNTTEEFIFDFSVLNNSNVLCTSESSGTIGASLTSVVVGSETSTITSSPGSTDTIKLSYSVKIEDQINMYNISFNNVIRSNGDIEDISVLLK